MYIHKESDWPRFHWDPERLAETLPAVRHQQGRLIGHMEALGFNLRQEAVFKTLTDDVLKTSEIEGEKLDVAQVRSSLARRLGIDIGGLKPADRNVDGIVEMMLDATRNYAQPLTTERLFGWHESLFPTGRSGMMRIKVGTWREDANGPMQVVSGPTGREQVHFEAPAARINPEMVAFLDWFNGEADIDLVTKAGLSHLWFVTIHPFDDGNGRIARRSRIWFLRAREEVHSASTACRRRSSGSAPLTTTSSSKHRKEPWTSRSGWNGSSAAWAAPSRAPRPRWRACCRKRGSGSRWRTFRSICASVWCSIASSMALRAISRRRSGLRWASARKTLPCEISWRW